VLSILCKWSVNKSNYQNLGRSIRENLIVSCTVSSKCAWWKPWEGRKISDMKRRFMTDLRKSDWIYPSGYLLLSFWWKHFGVNRRIQLFTMWLRYISHSSFLFLSTVIHRGHARYNISIISSYSPNVYVS